MKKLIMRSLCLILCLALPMTALAEKQPWLQPLARQVERMDTSAQAVMTYQADADAALALFERVMEEIEKEELERAAELNKDDEESLKIDQAYVQRELETTRSAGRIYIPGVLGLLNHTKITVETGDNWNRYDLSINDRHWADLGLIVQKDGNAATLISDLFPAHGLTATADGVLDGENPVQAAQRQVRKAWKTLAELQGFDVLGAFFSAYRQGMNRLADDQLAIRQGEDIAYEETSGSIQEGAVEKDALWAILQSRELEIDPRLYGLLDLLSGLTEQESQAFGFLLDSEDGLEDMLTSMLPEVDGEWTEEDYQQALEAAMNQSFSKENYKRTAHRQYVLTGNEITCEETITTEYDLTAAPQETQESPLEQESGQQVKKPVRNTENHAWRLTPSTLEYHISDGQFMEMVLSLDTGAEDEITANLTWYLYLSGFDDSSLQMNFRLERDEDGRHGEMTVSAENLGLPSYLSSDNLLRLTMDYDNDLSFMRYGLYALDGQEPLLSILYELQYQDTLLPAPDLGEKTMVSMENEEALKAVWSNFRAEGLPRLNKLILTGLPAEAKSLMTALLALTAGLAQMGK